MKFNKGILQLIQLPFLLSFLGCSDGDFQIYGDFYFRDSGGTNKYIFTKKKGVENKVLVPIRVDKYLLINNKIYVAQRLVESKETNDSFRYFLLDICKYYVIDVISGELKSKPELRNKIKELRCSFESN